MEKNDSISSDELKKIFKAKLIFKGYNTWKELINVIGEENQRCFTDWFNGKQALSKDVLEKTFEILDIPLELLDVYAEPVIKYKIKK